MFWCEHRHSAFMRAPRRMINRTHRPETGNLINSGNNEFEHPLKKLHHFTFLLNLFIFDWNLFIPIFLSLFQKYPDTFLNWICIIIAHKKKHEQNHKTVHSVYNLTSKNDWILFDDFYLILNFFLIETYLMKNRGKTMICFFIIYIYFAKIGYIFIKNECSFYYDYIFPMVFLTLSWHIQAFQVIYPFIFNVISERQTVKKCVHDDKVNCWIDA